MNAPFLHSCAYTLIQTVQLRGLVVFVVLHVPSNACAHKNPHCDPHKRTHLHAIFSTNVATLRAAVISADESHISAIISA